MKTILVIYTNTKLAKKDSQTSKRYAFNTKSKVKLGDLLASEHYSTKMQVVEILPTCYKYVDTFSGELSNKRKPSTKQFEIRELNAKKKETSTVIDCLVDDCYPSEDDCF